MLDVTGSDFTHGGEAAVVVLAGEGLVKGVGGVGFATDGGAVAGGVVGVGQVATGERGASGGHGGEVAEVLGGFGEFAAGVVG